MTSLVRHAPRFSPVSAENIAEETFGIQGSAEPLPSERDQNFRIQTPEGENYVLKIANALEDPEMLDCQNLAMTHISDRRSEFDGDGACCPGVCRSLSGESMISAAGEGGQSYLVRMLTYVPGRPLAKVRPHSPELMEALGLFFGQMDRVLSDFDHPSAHRDFYWDLRKAGPVIEEKRAHIVLPERRELVTFFLDRYLQNIEGRLGDLRTGIIHSDGNDYNIMARLKDRWSLRIEGVIDFGDMVHTQVINEPAILCAYAMMGKNDPLSTARQIVSGYHRGNPLSEDELAVLFDLICIRLCVSVCNSAEQSRKEPDNEYLTISEKPAWELLPVLRDVHPRFACCVFREACGMPPVPRSAEVSAWLNRHTDECSPVTGRPLTSENALVLDISVESPVITPGPELQKPALLTDRLFGMMKAAGASVSIGRYNEPRLGYVSEQYMEPGNELPRRRNIHLGIDLFMEEGSPVHAPLDGVVHSRANNDLPLDYGPAIILGHETGDGDRFYTLYGHLSLESLDRTEVGQKVRAGEIFAHIGSSKVNGGSPPHVHVQVILDMIGLEGNYPGVSREDYHGIWACLSPSPDGLLGLTDLPVNAGKADASALLRVREKHLGKNLSIAYDRPLNIVRGMGPYLFTDMGQPYLDCVNNVCHVGHCHPYVVAAGQNQMAVLNTNTRYLHENIVRYAERLLATFPDPLSVCFFVCSGSEANELALRLARNYTSARDIIMVDGAYHGNTQGLIDISPYKHDGPGGKGAPSWAHRVLMPCGYRGPYKGMSEETGRRYAEDVGASVARIQDQGGRPAAFICESMLGCGGQVILPDGYLAGAFEKVRAAGGVCIADEVQVGFGRAGSHFWAFETQNVIPDIVTLGKPIGNGHPLAAVVTTPEIAGAFNNGMEYFNTFGGNPVSCAVGMAVLDVIENEKLQENARDVGRYLLERLRPLKEKYPLVGHVRGLGLYIGVELVKDRKTLEPAGDEAAYICNRLKGFGILMSTDGPLHNVLKIKPPIVFSREHADRVADALDAVLGEDCLQVVA